MPPSASRKTRTRKQPDAPDRSDGDDMAAAAATPSRKRRKVNTTAEHAASPNGTEPAPPASSRGGRKNRQSDIQILEDEPSFDEETAEEQVNTVIRGLRITPNVQARVDFANEVQQAEHPEGKQAYAKIAGNGWTFYVEDLQIRIGRPPDERPPSEGKSSANGASSFADKNLVHIDLGPSKLVSRLHAEITYDENNSRWQIHIVGRNGAKLDERPLKREDIAVLHSGSVIEIAETQMMFVTPNEEPEIHPGIRDNAKRRLYEEDEDEDDIDLMPPPGAHRTPTRSNGPAGGTRPAPSSTNQTQQNHKTNAKGAPRYSSAAPQDDNTSDTRMPSSVSKLRTSPSFARTLLLESGDDVDYAADSAKDLKPPYSYAQMIGMAILSTPDEKITLAKIYDWIKERFAFYRLNGGGWQNSIRHNLSLNKSFEKVARRTDEPGKGMKWQIVPDQRDEFMKKSFSSARKGMGRGGSSMPGSPMRDQLSSTIGDRAPEDPFVTKPKYEHDDVKPKRSSVKHSPGSTPPMANYPSIKTQAFTPDRPGRFSFANDSSPRHAAYGLSPFPLRSEKKPTGLNDSATAGSPSGPPMLLHSDANDHLQTPLISKAPKLAPPSTARLPSHFMPMSSPAPFWKYADFSTPAKGAYDSPVKMEPNTGKQEDVKMVLKEPIRSSSPPLPDGEVGRGSPTKDLSSRTIINSSQPRQCAGDAARTGPSPPVQNESANQDSSDEEEGMIDLAKGFQPIGKFHSMGAVRGS